MIKDLLVHLSLGVNRNAAAEYALALADAFDAHVAAMAFAYTYSLGQACCWYFGEIKAGHMPSADDLNRVWSEQLQSAMVTWKSHRG